MFDPISLILATLTVCLICGISDSRKKRKMRQQKEQDNDRKMKVWMEYNLHIDSSLDAEANYPDPVNADRLDIIDYIYNIKRLDIALRYLDIAKECNAKKNIIWTIESQIDILYIELRRKLFGA